MAEIHDLEEEKIRREVADLLKSIGTFKKIDKEINACGISIVVTGFLVGAGEMNKDKLTIMLYSSGEVIGVIRLERGQWMNLKSFADVMFGETSSDILSK
ncbi:MAG: hypothetical protein WAV21_03210 [Minisyncoccia bacterium]